jgi:hypothetical protein
VHDDEALGPSSPMLATTQLDEAAHTKAMETEHEAQAPSSSMPARRSMRGCMHDDEDGS